MTALPNYGLAQREGDDSSLDVARDRSVAEMLRIEIVFRGTQHGGQE